MKHRHPIVLALLLIAPLILGGCTREKAQAVVAAAERLKTSSTRAVADYQAWQDAAFPGLDPDAGQSLEQRLDSLSDDIVGTRAGTLQQTTVEAFIRDILEPKRTAIPPAVQRMQSMATAIEAAVAPMKRASWFMGKPVKSLSGPLADLAGNEIALAESVAGFPMAKTAVNDAWVSLEETYQDTSLDEGVRKKLVRALVQEMVARTKEANAQRETAVASLLLASLEAMDLEAKARDYDRLSLHDILTMASELAPLAEMLTRGRIAAAEVDKTVDAVRAKAAELGIPLKQAVTVSNTKED